MEEAIELVFIPVTPMGHLVPAVELAKLLLQTRQHLSITLFIIKLPYDPDFVITTYIDSLVAQNDNPRLKLIQLDIELHALMRIPPGISSFFRYIFDSQKPKIRDCVNEIQKSGSVKLAGFVLDTLCIAMMDVAEEFGVPTYVFNSSSAAFLGLYLHLQSLRDDHGKDVTQFKDSDPDLNIPTYSKPFPPNLLPDIPLDVVGGVLDNSKRIRKAKGIIVNTILELERHALESFSKHDNLPPVYPVGPILNLKSQKKRESEEEIIKWLDDQPATSVVFLCFGSAVAFPEPQVKEIAYALECSGQRFLWTLRKPGSPVPTVYTNPEEVLPEGFLERTKSIGKIIGWAPQAAVLAHPSVGGFVSHCGWNSTLESIWFGVPIATWPMNSDQPANAFQLTTDIGMAVEIKMDYKSDSTVNAKDIEIGITGLMNQSASNSIKIKAKEMKEMSRKALKEGGSSFNFIQSFFENVMNNLK